MEKSIIFALVIGISMVIAFICAVVEIVGVWWMVGFGGVLFVVGMTIAIVIMLKQKRRLKQDCQKETYNCNKAEEKCDKIESNTIKEESLGSIKAETNNEDFEVVKNVDKSIIKTNRKKVLSREEMEKSRLETSICEITKCLDVYKTLEGNSRLENIVHNFLKENDLVGIELLAIPIKHTTAGNTKPRYKLEDIDKVDITDIHLIKYTLISAFNYWKKHKSLSVQEEFYEVEQKNRQLYDILRNEKIIECDYRYFCLYMSECQKKIRIEKYNQIIEKYGIKETCTDEEIIKTLYNLNVPEIEISSIIALHYYVHSDNEIYVENYVKALEVVHTQISRIDKQSYLDRLEKGIKEEKATLVEIDLMSGSEFESFIASLFEKMGYKIELTKASGDQGIDIVVMKHGDRIAIQTKCYSSVVGNHAIMEAVAGMKYYNANKCMVITNSMFTKSAKELAKANDVELWDRQVLKEKMEEI